MYPFPVKLEWFITLQEKAVYNSKLHTNNKHFKRAKNSLNINN